MPINSQAKGKRAEREVAKLINRYLGTNVRRTPLSGGLNFKGDICDINPDSPAFNYHFEVKMNAQFYATMQFTDWLSLLAEIEELKESNRGLEEEVEDRTHKYNLLLRKSEDESDND